MTIAKLTVDSLAKYSVPAQQSSASIAYRVPSSTVARSLTVRNEYLKSIIDKSPRYMSQWLENGKVPPGYQVHHNIPLFQGGADSIANMRMIDIGMHQVITNLWRLK